MAIATTLANEGKADEIASYQSAVTALGYANLAAVAGAGPTATSETTGTPDGGIGSVFSNTGSGSNSTGCLNPSCTSL